ncbi:DUF3892 domain-containing protein [Roseateles toxinivorans]|uniref:Uncharacterized protein DUF3892 n=1 Tax=Roseateles toxinivorans TaxID=270368 RepID=A0A4V3CSH9_9BURK|nr:DUF3892 domain-containing protein [Roseateles toxinivorans]TDP60642.1 uncharacterized protein DUF3892 [Roseateles toxinivorans]
MADVQITCITLSATNRQHEHITHVGGGAGKWKWTVAQVVASIDAKTNTFFVQDPRSGKRANVGVVREAGKAPFIRTYADSVWTDNLLSLPACP